MQEKFVITGGNKLSGEIEVAGAKNAVLKFMKLQTVSKKVL